MAYDKIKTENYALMGGVNNKASPYNTGPQEFRDLTNMRFPEPGAISKRPGSTLAVGATVSGRVTGGVEFQRLNGASYLVAMANTNAYTVNSSNWTPFKSGILSGAIFDFVTYVDRLFSCNGQDYFKFDGANTTAYSLPQGAGSWGVTSVVGGGMSGTFVASYGYLNDVGYYGPAATGITISLNGVTFGSIKYYGLTTQTGFGITALVFYRTSPGGVDLTGTTFAPVGTTTVTDANWPLATLQANDNLYFTLTPRYIEIYNNQLFMAGFSSLPSTAYWSQVGTPEGVDPSYFAEFRTDDGDRITGMKSFLGSLILTKQYSVHQLKGDNPSDFLLQEVSDQYGCLSNQAMVVFENRLWFLDQKGIVEFDGSGIKIVSTKVEDYFSDMTIESAKDNAVALHVKEYNEVWFAIPTAGATYNNRIVVYDYYSAQWTKYEGIDASALFIAKQALDKKTVHYGGYTGNLFYMGASFCGDNGRSITCMLLPPFLAPGGQTTEQQFRRYYINLEPVLGVTQPITVNFRTNYGTTIQLTRTMYQAPFQSRVDFGLSARSLQPEVFHVSASLPFTVYGYALASRFQRDS